MNRCTKAEEQLNNVMSNDYDGIEAGDLSSSISYASGSNLNGIGGGELLQRRRSNGQSYDNAVSRNIKSEISSDLERNYGVKPAPAVARSLDVIDTWAQLTGR